MYGHCKIPFRADTLAQGRVSLSIMTLAQELAQEARILRILADRSLAQAERAIARAEKDARKKFLVWLLYGGGLEKLAEITK